MRLYFIFLFFVVPLFVACVVILKGTLGSGHTLGIYRRSERNGFSIRGPLQQIRACGKLRQWMGFAAVHRQQVYLRVSASRRQKRDGLSIRRPLRGGVLSAARQ